MTDNPNVMLIGDNFFDTYKYGKVKGISNEAPAMNFVVEPSMSNLHIHGGIYFVGECFNRYAGFGWETMLNTTSRSIDRYVDLTHGARTVFQVEHPGRADAVLTEHELRKELELHPPDLIMVSISQKSESSIMVADVLPEYGIPLYVDSGLPEWDNIHVDWLKMSSAEANGKRLFKAKNVVITSDTSIHSRGGTGLQGYGIQEIETIENPLDTCGAGDVFFASLVASIITDGFSSKAIRLAASRATESVNHYGCYLPEEETP